MLARCPLLALILGSFVLLAGCAGDRAATDAAPLPPPDGRVGSGEAIRFPDGPAAPRDTTARAEQPPVADGPAAATKLTLYVNLGDSLAAGYSASPGHSYRALLMQNDDLLYPSYQGRDLKSRFPGIVLLDRAKSGAQTKDVVLQAKSVPGNPAGNTLVVVSAGGNDFNDNILAMIDPLQAAAVAQAAAANLQLIYDHFAQQTLFPGKVSFVMLNVHDPTDGRGTIPALPGLTGFCSTLLKLGPLAGGIGVKNLAAFNGALSAFAKTRPVLAVDNHGAFIGHGLNYADKTCPCYQPADPTLWFHIDCAHGNDRGHHELRRLIWKAVTGEQG